MMRCRSYSLAFLVAALALVLGGISASAALTVQVDKTIYNLGDQIVAQYDISTDQSFSGLLRLSLTCSDYTLDFYTVPTGLAAGERQNPTVAPLSVSRNMLGKCFVDATATTYDHSSNETGTSSVFNVSNEVAVGVLIQKTTYLPSETVEISGAVGKSHLFPASVLITFDGNENQTLSVNNNNFVYGISLPANIKSGRHSLDFFVNDSYGNSGSESAEFGVSAVPTRIVNKLSSQEVKPGEPFSVSVTIYDQADDRIQSDVDVAVAGSDGSSVLSASKVTGANITLAFPEGQKPGLYTLTSSGNGLVATSSITVDEVEAVSVSFGNGVVAFRNTGNIDYVKRAEIGLAGQTSYMITPDLDLKPGQVQEVDLTKDVYGGTYTISLPNIEGSPVFENAAVSDKRSLSRKVLDSFGMTGKQVQVTSSGQGKVPAMIAPYILLVIILGVAVYFVRRRSSGSSRGSSGGDMGFGSDSGETSETASATPARTTPVQTQEDIEQAGIKRILEEKYKQQLARKPVQPNNLRTDPVAQKFVKDMMKEKKFR